MTTVEDRALPPTNTSRNVVDAVVEESRLEDNKCSLACSLKLKRREFQPLFKFSMPPFSILIAHRPTNSCDECGGKGTVITKACPHCQGAKVLSHKQTYTLEVIPGMPEGLEVVYEGEGDESPDFEPGDVVLRVSSKKRGEGEEGWKRKEANLYWTEIIGVDDALLGFKRNITHLDGKPVEIKRTGVTQPGE